MLIVLDANVWIRFARSRSLAALVNSIALYKLMPVTNNYLLSEVFDIILKHKWATASEARRYIDYVKSISMFITENVVYRLSPDPKDNFLFDIAIQHNCSVIISDDTELLSFRMQPVKVKSVSWFFKNFPV
ncbi:putative toxin-antitoxin system toxin component, PIN family [Foetidibacter luteolus]|uniref:putative toxin-antitoxin system toxin component, PIN family n=1 Tax=Foetidibacter luteolus TaxID=2608880 RepID=UPI00129BA6D0|nr:putative toxin-antitoxin system toxin component, PIN family [Foetidibacter luteolus]